MPTLATGSPVYGKDFPPSQFDHDWTGQFNLTTTSYASGTPSVAVNITAPTSGKILVCVGAGIRNNGANADQGIVTYRLLEDSSEGTVFTAESERRGVQSVGIGSEEFRYVGNFSLETGLTPGRSYYVQIRHKTVTGAGTVDIASRNILCIPVP